MVVSGLAAAQRDTIDLAVGNLVGSNAANLTLVLGTGALLIPIRPGRQVFRREGGLMLGATLLVSAFLVDERLPRIEGVLLLVAMVGAAWFIAVGVDDASAADDESGDRPGDQLGEEGDDPAGEQHLGWAAAWMVGSLLGVVVGAQLLVTGAVAVAESLGASEAFIGLTVVAVGTSLPELATTIACARKGAVELIVGNVFGSNVFNSLAVAGVAGVLGTGLLDDPPTLSLAIMVAVTVAALVVGRHRGQYTRSDGIVLLAAYPVILLAGL
jgi:cation:H+ antiporter